MKKTRQIWNVANCLRLAACVISFFLIGNAARSFEGKVAIDRASSAESSNESISMLKLSVQRNPDDAQTILNLSDAMLKSGDSTGALHVLRTTSIGVNHWQGWHRQAKIWKEKANRPSGTIENAERAVELFERIIRVHPYHTSALEHCGEIVLKMKDWNKAAAIADRLEQIDFNNLSANYLRAQLANELGETTKALSILRRLSDQRGYPSSLFTKKMIQHQIEALQSEPKS